MGVYTGIAQDNVLINSGRATLNTLAVTGAATFSTAVLGTAPVTKTGNFSVGDSENNIICNGGASITVTLPAAASWVGREITIKTIAAFTVVSASANVVPINSATAGTAILAGTAGTWAKLVSNGTNWVIMAS